MHYLSLDTNTWIYLANGTEPVKLLEFIRQEVERGNIKIILPEIIITEWQRNKDKEVKQGGLKHFKDVTDSLDRILRLLGDKGERDILSFLIDEKDDKEYFLDFAKRFKQKKIEIEEAISRNITMIESLFNHGSTELIKISDAVMLKAGEFALANKAPFKKKNSFADALIILSFIEFVKSNSIEGALFISYNTEDFCEKKDGEKNLHPDLIPEFVETKSNFYRLVGEALNTIEKDILSKEELELIREFQEEAQNEHDIDYCDVCHEMNDRFNEVYFGHPVDLLDEREQRQTDVKQLNLYTEKEQKEQKPVPLYDKIEVGFCSWCNTEHFHCVSCGTLNAIWDNEYNERKECTGCGLPYLIEKGYEGSGMEETTYLLLDDKETCAKCGEQFLGDGSGTNICSKCEDEYSYGVQDGM